MCYTVKFYWMGFCNECQSNSVSFDQQKEMCILPDVVRNVGSINAVYPDSVGWYGLNHFYPSRDCAKGYKDEEITYRWSSLVGNVLRSFCVRCFSERQFHAFANDWAGQHMLEFHPILVTHIAQAPERLTFDRWRRRSLHLEIVRRESTLIYNENGQLKLSISKEPQMARLVLLRTAQIREGHDSTDFDQWVIHDDWHFFPASFFPPEQATYPIMNTQDCDDALLYVPSTLFDDQHWLPLGYRVEPNPDTQDWADLERRYNAGQVRM